MEEYFEKKSKVKAFQVPFDFQMGDTVVKKSSYIVVTDEVTLNLSKKEFEERYEKIALEHPVFFPFQTPTHEPEPFRLPYQRYICDKQKYGLEPNPYWGGLGEPVSIGHVIY